MAVICSSKSQPGINQVVVEIFHLDIYVHFFKIQVVVEELKESDYSTKSRFCHTIITH